MLQRQRMRELAAVRGVSCCRRPFTLRFIGAGLRVSHDVVEVTAFRLIIFACR